MSDYFKSKEHEKMLDLVTKFGEDLPHYLDNIDAKELNWGSQTTTQKRDKITFSHPRLRYYRVFIPGREQPVYNYCLDEMSSQDRALRGEYVTFDEFLRGYFGEEGYKEIKEEINNYRTRKRALQIKNLELIRRDPHLESQLLEKGVNNDEVIHKG